MAVIPFRKPEQKAAVSTHGDLNSLAESLSRMEAYTRLQAYGELVALDMQLCLNQLSSWNKLRFSMHAHRQGMRGLSLPDLYAKILFSTEFDWKQSPSYYQALIEEVRSRTKPPDHS